jgi:DNA-binding NarL/FixJ family response regulator
MPPRAVVARETELDRLRGFLTDAETHSLMLRGEPGIGKTVLWQMAVDQAVQLGRRVLVHRAAEQEASLAFTGLADLVGTVLDEVSDKLAPPRARALRVALMLEDPGEGPPPPPQATGLALFDVLRALCETGEVVVAIDDLQWLDSSTAAVLPLALRRLRGSPLKLLTTVRQAPGVQSPFAPDRVFGDDRALTITLPALDLSALHRLLRDRLAVDLPRPQLTRVHELSGGNPLFALELAQVDDVEVPLSLRDALDARLARLPAETADVLLTAAALARPTIAAVAPDDTRRRALERALADGVVEVDGSLMRFTHPLLASRCYERATPWRRREVHRDLAASASDVETRARHLALATEEPDEMVASELDQAVAVAVARNATAAAAELAELAVRLTPDSAVERRFTAAQLHHRAGDFQRARAGLAQLGQELPPGIQRADVMYMQAILGLEDVAARIRLCEQALVDARADDGRCAQIHGLQAFDRASAGDLRAGLAAARLGLQRAERSGDTRSVAVALGRVGVMETWALEITPGLLERGVELERSLSEQLLPVESPTVFRAVSFAEIGELDRSREMYEALLAAATRRGDEHLLQWTLANVAIVEWLAGRLPIALERVATAREIAESTGEPQSAILYGLAAYIEADSGLFERARASARTGRSVARELGDVVWAAKSEAALGRIELINGDNHAALKYLRPLTEICESSGNRSALMDPWADEMEALIGVGELDLAQAQLDRYQGWPCVNYRWGAVGAARVQGLLHAARGNRDEAIESLRASISADEEPVVFLLERGRTLLVMGVVQRQAMQRRAARETLLEAAELFDSLGASPWAAKARAELGRISGRGAAASDELTKVERQVADLAAAGRRNKEIAAELFITVGTVEAHLSRVYRKIGVRSRAELTARFTRDAASNRGVGTPQG